MAKTIAETEQAKAERRTKRRLVAAMALAANWPVRIRRIDTVQRAVALSRADARKTGGNVVRRKLRLEPSKRDAEVIALDERRARIAYHGLERAERKDAADIALERIVITETSEAFNEGMVIEARRIEYELDIELEKVWVAEAGACAVCLEHHGETFSLAEAPEEGGPGSIHPNCRCYWNIRRKD